MMNKKVILLLNVAVSCAVLSLLAFSRSLPAQDIIRPSPLWKDAKVIHEVAFLITLFQVYYLVGLVCTLCDRLDSVIAQALAAQSCTSSALSSIVAPGTLLTANQIVAPDDATELTVIFDGLAFDFFVTESKTSVGVTVENAATFGKPDTQSTDVFVNKRTLKVTTV